jgi:hypothetical protein
MDRLTRNDAFLCVLCDSVVKKDRLHSNWPLPEQSLSPFPPCFYVSVVKNIAFDSGRVFPKFPISSAVLSHKCDWIPDRQAEGMTSGMTFIEVLT